jgi:hypothetical protein
MSEQSTAQSESGTTPDGSTGNSWRWETMPLTGFSDITTQPSTQETDATTP